MRNKNFKKLSLALSTLISSVLFFVIGMGTSFASPATCTWTGGGDGTSWNSASNWSCTSGTIPANGDNLVFNQGTLSSNATINNNISGLQINDISFTGGSGLDFTLNGDPITLAAGITDTGNANVINLGITLSGNQTFNADSLDTLGSINLGTYNLALTGDGYELSGALSGTGTLSINGTGSYMNTSSPSLSTPVQVNGGLVYANIATNDAFGTGGAVVANGATVEVLITASGTYPANAPLTVGGSGSGSAAQVKFDNSSGGSATVNYSGNIKLVANAQVNLVSTNLDIIGTVSGCGYTISSSTGSTGTLSGNLNGSCTSPTNGSNSGTTNTSSNSSSSAKDPDTGYGSPSKTPLSVIMLGLASLSLVCLGLRLANQPKRNV